MLNLIFNIQNYYFNPLGLPYYIVGILTLLEGIYIFIQNRRALVNLAYMLSCLFVALWLTGMGFVFSSKYEAVALILTRYYVFLGIIFLTPAIYFFSASWQWSLFPEEKKKKKPVVIFNFIVGVIFYLFCMISPLFIQGMWHYKWGFYPKAGSVYIIFIIWFFTLMVLLLLNFIEVYKKEKIPIRKRQAKLMIIAFSIAYLGSYEFLLNYGVSLYLLAFIPVFICINIVGYSVIRYKLMDIETVIHKTIGWAFTTIILIVPFVILLYFTRSWYMSLNDIGAFSYFGSLFLLFLFFVRIFQPRVDHLFQRRRYNLEEISSCFIDDVVHLKGINQLVQRIEETIARTLYPQRIDIFIYDEDRKVYMLVNRRGEFKEIRELNEETPFLLWLAQNNKIAHKEFVDIDPLYAPIKEAAKDYFNLTQSVVAAPLVLGEKLLGVINLGRKASLRRYSALDFHFLTILKNQSAIAISNSLLYENIEEQVRQRTKELVEVQKQLIQAEKLATVGTLAGGVAHEINNPLVAILTNVQMLLTSDTIRDESDRESLQIVEEATKRCRSIIKKLMTYARRPMDTTDISKVDLLDVIKSVISFLGYQLEQENIKIITEAQEATYPTYGNHNELEQVVTNIVLNAKDAIKRIKRGGNIYISLFKDSDWIKIRVKDEGIGIPKEIMPRIFDPFFTTKEVGRGLGLGLSICQAIIERHNGLIDVQSELNKGSIFTIQLPKARKEKGHGVKLDRRHVLKNS
jgi:signal transduction histidine kinase